ncbi:26S proteasome non-ATPase regulatory subunit 5 [Portunus trituberculatus]|uniref:26S proteasome non-ATPase regulatory subunit 5 n=1 Tax=Portunus trituberculatus TaxID=210409 RepID=A0A5B7H3M0_PORTR|nr:26S proteasome non-ATPase regulatory subunit 5 [Portunus trituberculatus]
MLHLVLKSVGDKCLGVVKLASSVVVKMCHQPVGLTAVFCGAGLAVIQEMVAQRDTTRFNVYELVVEVGLLGSAALSVAVNTGLLDRLLSEVTTGDGLTQLTALQLLIPLALTPGGRALLDERGVTARLMYLLSLAKSDPIARLLTHGSGPSKGHNTLDLGFSAHKGDPERPLHYGRGKPSSLEVT